MDLPWLSRWQPQVLAILRIVTGLLFLEHGLSKYFAFPVPFPVHPLPPMLMAAGAIEIITGILITIGLFTRLAAFIASGEMAFAYFIEHLPHSFFPVVNDGALAIVLCFACLFLAAAGGGPISVDAMRR